MGDASAMLARLAAETHVHHAEADADVDSYLFGPRTTRAEYRTFLARLYGFVMPLEAGLATVPGLDQFIDVGERMKAPALLHDLLALGYERSDIAELPQCLTVPPHRGAASALGWMYVVERPMMATATLRHHLETRLPGEMNVASTYLQLYNGIAGARWRDFGIALDCVAAMPAVGDRIVAAAQAAFRTLARWRLTELPRVETLRVAG
jgi:heme oxygenase